MLLVWLRWCAFHHIYICFTSTLFFCSKIPSKSFLPIRSLSNWVFINHLNPKTWLLALLIYFQIALTYPFTTILVLCNPCRISLKKISINVLLFHRNCVWHPQLNKDECLHPISLFLSIHKWLLTPTRCVNEQLFKKHTYRKSKYLNKANRAIVAK